MPCARRRLIPMKVRKLGSALCDGRNGKYARRPPIEGHQRRFFTYRSDYRARAVSWRHPGRPRYGMARLSVWSPGLNEAGTVRKVGSLALEVWFDKPGCPVVCLTGGIDRQRAWQNCVDALKKIMARQRSRWRRDQHGISSTAKLLPSPVTSTQHRAPPPPPPAASAKDSPHDLGAGGCSLFAIPPHVKSARHSRTSGDR